MTATIISLFGRREQGERQEAAPTPARTIRHPKPRKGVKASRPAGRFVPFGPSDGLGIAERELAQCLEDIAEIGQARISGPESQQRLRDLTSKALSCRAFILATKPAGILGIAVKLRMAKTLGMETPQGKGLVDESIAAILRLPSAFGQRGDDPEGGAA